MSCADLGQSVADFQKQMFRLGCAYPTDNQSIRDDSLLHCIPSVINNRGYHYHLGRTGRFGSIGQILIASYNTSGIYT